MPYDVDYYRNNYRSKFLRLLDSRFADIPPRTRRNKFIDIYNERYYTDVGSSMRSWLSGSVRKVPGIEVLMQVCNVLECDVEYFLTDQKEFQKDSYDAVDVTGLEYETIEQLKRYTPEYRHIIDILARPYDHTDEDTAYDASINLQDDYLHQILRLVIISTKFSPATHAHIMDDVLGNMINSETGDETKSLIEAHTSLQFSSIIDKVKEITFDNQFFIGMSELITEEKMRLLQTGMSQPQVEIEISRRRSDIAQRVIDMMSKRSE